MKKETKWIILFWGLLFVFLLVCNILLPPISDDFIHMEIAKGGFQAAVENYMTTNPRFGQCLLCWFAGAMHPIAFDFLNAVIGTIFIFLLFVLIEGRVPKSRMDYGEMSFIIIAILLATMFGSVFLWMSGATNYLWGYTLIALHWIPYRLFWKNGGFDMSKWAIVPFFFLSVFAGWSSEQVGIMSILIHLGLLCYGFASKKIRFSIWVWVGVVGFIAGFMLLYFSPGIGERSAEAASFMSIGQVLSLRPFDLAKYIVLTIGYASSKEAFDILVLSLSWYFLSKQRYNKVISTTIIAIMVIIFGVLKLEPIPVQVAYFYLRITLSVILLIIAILCLFKKNNILAIMYIVYFVALLSTIQIMGHLPERAKFAQSFILITMSIYALRSSLSDFISKPYIHILCGLCALGVIGAFADFNHKQNEVFRLINESKNSNKKEVCIPSNLFQSPYKNIGDWGNMGGDPEHWANKAYAEWYKVESVYVYE